MEEERIHVAEGPATGASSFMVRLSRSLPVALATALSVVVSLLVMLAPSVGGDVAFPAASLAPAPVDTARPFETVDTEGATAVTRTHDGAGKIETSSDGSTYAYDDNGQITSQGTGSAATTLEYNLFGEVIGQSTGTSSLTFTRDALGRVSSRDDGSSTRELGYWGTTNAPTDVGSSASPLSLTRNADGSLLSSYDGTVTQHAWLNIHGDLSAWRTEATGGAFTSTSLYDAFGTPTSTGTDAVGLGFQAMPHDPVSGLVDMGARSYDTSLGSFTAEDTVIGDLRSTTTLNRYAYANGAPLDHFDPDGRFSNPFAVVTSAISRIGSYIRSALYSIGRYVYSALRSWSSSTSASSVGAALSQVRSSAARALQAAKPVVSSVAGSAVNALGTLAQRVAQGDVHAVLDVAGFIPGPVGVGADVANAGLYLIEGDTKNALISVAATILPVKMGRAVAKDAPYSGALRQLDSSSGTASRLTRGTSPSGATRAAGDLAPSVSSRSTRETVSGAERRSPTAAAKGASGLSDDLARLANQHVTGSGDTVLGRYPGYITKANSKGANYFDIGDDWNKLVARGQDPWALNQHFLDGRIAAGDRILLSVPKGDIVPGTYLAREVQYLTSNGYRWTNQWSLRPGG